MVPSEVESGSQNHDPVSGRAGNAAEVGGIDVVLRIAELWRIQNVDSVGAEFEFLAFANLDPLHQIYIEAPRHRSASIEWRQVSERTRSRIHHQDVARSVRDREERAASVQRLCRGQTRNLGIRYLAKVLEVNHSVID